VLTLVQLPRLDGQQMKGAWFGALDGAGLSVRVEPVERKALPAWLAQRLARQGQRVQGGEAGQQTLAFFADRVEGNLLAAHQELQKLGLLYPRRAELRAGRGGGAERGALRRLQARRSRPGGQVARALRMLDGLRAEGEARCWCTGRWPRTSARCAGAPRRAGRRQARCRWR
jgi:DNA polymerase-3 subunit delta